MLETHKFINQLINILNPQTTAVTKEKDGEIHIFIELPGIQNREDISISVSASKLIVKGVRRKIDRSSQLSDLSKNNNREMFEKTFILPSPVRPETASAVYSKGVLELRLKKLTEKIWDKVYVQFM